MVSNIFYFHPYLGKIPILTNIFQMGWNHQLDEVFLPRSLRYNGLWTSPKAVTRNPMVSSAFRIIHNDRLLTTEGQEFSLWTFWIYIFRYIFLQENMRERSLWGFYGRVPDICVWHPSVDLELQINFNTYDVRGKEINKNTKNFSVSPFISPFMLLNYLAQILWR